MFRKPKRSAKSSLRKRPSKTEKEEPSLLFANKKNDSSSSESNEDDDTIVASKKPVTKKRKNNIITSSTIATTTSSRSNIMHQFESTKESLSEKDMATRTADYHPDDDDAKKKNDDDDDDNQKKISLAPPKERNKFLAGPLRASKFVRSTCIFDYQPDICKDYKDTGFCGFGDTCIYLHDRGNTLKGWELEREWERKKKQERDEKEKELVKFMKGGGNGETTEDDGGGGLGKISEEDGIPFACHICRGPFANPIVTKCGHYFCESCIMEAFKSDPACPVCRNDTLGVYNYPQKLISKKRRIVGAKGSWKEFKESFS